MKPSYVFPIIMLAVLGAIASGSWYIVDAGHVAVATDVIHS